MKRNLLLRMEKLERHPPAMRTMRLSATEVYRELWETLEQHLRLKLGRMPTEAEGCYFAEHFAGTLSTKLEDWKREGLRDNDLSVYMLADRYMGFVDDLIDEMCTVFPDARAAFAAEKQRILLDTTSRN